VAISMRSANLARGSDAGAKEQDTGRKQCNGKRKCNQQVGQCREFVASECAQAADPEACEDLISPCCEFLGSCQARAMFECLQRGPRAKRSPAQSRPSKRSPQSPPRIASARANTEGTFDDRHHS
jgi:hypothetical protein